MHPLQSPAQDHEFLDSSNAHRVIRKEFSFGDPFSSRVSSAQIFMWKPPGFSGVCLHIVPNTQHHSFLHPSVSCVQEGSYWQWNLFWEKLFFWELLLGLAPLFLLPASSGGAEGEVPAATSTMAKNIACHWMSRRSKYAIMCIHLLALPKKKAVKRLYSSKWEEMRNLITE